MSTLSDQLVCLRQARMLEQFFAREHGPSSPQVREVLAFIEGLKPADSSGSLAEWTDSQRRKAVTLKYNWWDGSFELPNGFGGLVTDGSIHDLIALLEELGIEVDFQEDHHDR